MSTPAFLFPGQGAQTVGMGRQLVESLHAARELFERAAGIVGYDLLAVCLEGPAEKLDSTVYSQPALFVTSLAALAWLYRDEDKAGIVKLCTQIASDPNPEIAQAAMTVLAFCVGEVEAARTELRRLSKEGSAEMREIARQKLSNAELRAFGSR